MHDWQGLARDALEMLGEGVSRQGYPTWLQIYEDPDDEVGLRVEAYCDPTGLLGWTAPPDCIALGVVATGKARTAGDKRAADKTAEDQTTADKLAEDKTTEDTTAAERTVGRAGLRCGAELADRVHDAGGALSLRMACIVSRDQGLGWWMELPDGSTHGAPPSAGRMLDALLRCLGRPTAPPQEPASEIHAAAWLGSVIDGGLSSDRRLTWRDVEQLHPLARVLAGDLNLRVKVADERNGLAEEELAGLLRIAAAACSWEEIRAQAAQGNLSAFVDPDLAEWMDEGMFSRWILSAIPSVDQLLEAARPLLVPSAARRLAHAVHLTPMEPASAST